MGLYFCKMELEQILVENRKKKTIAQLREERRIALEQDKCDSYGLLGFLGGCSAVLASTAVGGIFSGISYCCNHPNNYLENGLYLGIAIGTISTIAGIVADGTRSD